VKSGVFQCGPVKFGVVRSVPVLSGVIPGGPLRFGVVLCSATRPGENLVELRLYRIWTYKLAATAKPVRGQLVTTMLLKDLLHYSHISSQSMLH
jgi:hypothetical protein